MAPDWYKGQVDPQIEFSIFRQSDVRTLGWVTGTLLNQKRTFGHLAEIISLKHSKTSESIQNRVKSMKKSRFRLILEQIWKKIFLVTKAVFLQKEK